jgi:molecular chaperone HtpG
VPLWAKPRDQVSQADYDEFYKREFNDANDPLRIISMHARGSRSCDVLLYVPAEPPADLYSPDFKKGLELYSSGVMIMEQCDALLPEYFGFVRGVVDSPDLSLNLSREAMQEDEFLKAVAQQIDKRLLMEMEAMRDNERDQYVELFANFGRMFKYAIYATFGALNAKLEDLLLFFTANRDEPVTLKEYRESMPGNQPFLFFASGDDAGRLEASPSVSAVTARGFDVLLCSESIDELALMTLREYAGVPIKNVTAEDLGLDDLADVEFVEQVNGENRALFQAMKDLLPADVVEVRATARLASIPACITAKGPVSLGMEKYFASLPDEMGGRPQIQHALELNPRHSVFGKLQGFHVQGDVEALGRYAAVLHGQALLAEGLPVADLAAYSKAVYELL